MNILGGLNFEPIPLRTGRWRAEITGMSYMIVQASTGFVIDCQRTLEGSTGEASVHGTPTDFFTTFEAAVEASNVHYRQMMK